MRRAKAWQRVCNRYEPACVKLELPSNEPVIGRSNVKTLSPLVDFDVWTTPPLLRVADANFTSARSVTLRPTRGVAAQLMHGSTAPLPGAVTSPTSTCDEIYNTLIRRRNRSSNKTQTDANSCSCEGSRSDGLSIAAVAVLC